MARFWHSTQPRPPPQPPIIVTSPSQEHVNIIHVPPRRHHGRADADVVRLGRDLDDLVALLDEVAVDLAGRGLEGVRVALLDEVEALVGETVDGRQHRREAGLEGLRGVVGLDGDGLRGGVGPSGVRVFGEDGVDGGEGVADERDGADAGKDGKLGASRGSLCLRGHCWRTMLRRTRRVCGSWNCDKKRGKERI